MHANTKNNYQCSLNFRTLAHGMWISFYATFVIGGILTFTITDYDAETDIVYRFYQTFNPRVSSLTTTLPIL